MPERRMISRDIYDSSVAWTLGTQLEGYDGLKAQRVWEALILLADDYGNGKLIPAMIRKKAFASVPDVEKDVTEDDIIKWINLIEAMEKAVLTYEYAGQKFYTLTGWEHYQRGNWRPEESNIPLPPKELFIKYGLSIPNFILKALDKSEKSKLEVLGTELNEGKGREGNGKEGKERKEGKEEPPPALSDGEKKRHLNSVYLTDGEYRDLRKRYGIQATDSMIQDLELYMKSKNKSYDSHYDTILRWFKRDKVPEINNLGWKCLGCSLMGQDKPPDKCPRCGTLDFTNGKLQDNWKELNQKTANK